MYISEYTVPDTEDDLRRNVWITMDEDGDEYDVLVMRDDEQSEWEVRQVSGVIAKTPIRRRGDVVDTMKEMALSAVEKVESISNEYPDD